MKLPVGERSIVDVKTLAYRGQGVARTDEGMVIFINRALPHETVEVEIIKAKKRYREAEIVRVIAPSIERIEAPCPYFGKCGGCTWQNLTYAGQLEAKRMEVEDSLAHLGRITDIKVSDPLGMNDPWHYRNRMDFSFADIDGHARIGLHKRQSFNQIIPIASCLILDSGVDAIIEKINSWADDSGLSAYDMTTTSGVLRTAVIRISRSTGESMLNIVTTDALKGSPDIAKLARELGLTSLWHTINNSKNDSSVDEQRLVDGKPAIKESIGQLVFSISPGSFFQTNTEMAKVLYDCALEGLKADAGCTVIDLFCGTGTIALELATRFAHVIGIESEPQAITNARANAGQNLIGNVDFIEGTVETTLADLLGARDDIKTAVVNPPRAGIHPKALKTIGSSTLERLVYISCNPTTLSRDLAMLVKDGFVIERIQPVDMFPHTYHVETIVGLSR